MNAAQQRAMADRLRWACQGAGIVITEPDPEAKPMPGGHPHRPVTGDGWLKVVAFLVKSGYRLVLYDEDGHPVTLRCL